MPDDPLAVLCAQLLVERYAPIHQEPAAVAAGSIVVAERRRLLCEALDGRHLVVVDPPAA